MILDQQTADFLWHTHKIRFFPKLRNPLRILGGDARFEPFSQHPLAKFMPLGAYSYSLSYLDHVESTGRYCSIGKDVQVMGDAHPTSWISSSPAFYRPRRARQYESKRTVFPDFSSIGEKIVVDHDVWIGDGALLAHGIRLGTGCIIGARAIVTRDVPPYAIVAGAPASIIRYRFPDQTVERLLASEWWDWPFSTWNDVDPRSIDAFLDHHQKIQETTERLKLERISANDALAVF